MKKRVCSLMLMFCMMVGMMLSVGAAGTPSDWAAAEVKTAIAEGLTTDKVTKDYQKNITREEFCELVVILYQKLTGKTVAAKDNPFSDTDNTEILKAYALGIVNGVSQTEFAPNNTITRQEMCVMIVRAIEAVLGEEFILKYDFVNFADNREIANWAFEQIYYAYEKGIVKGVGDNKFAPLGTATCEQAVIMLFRLYENIDDCRDVIPREVIDGYENYTYVNETFKEIEKKYTDENGYVIPGKVLDLLNEVYAQAQKMLENGDIQGAQLNLEYLNVCVVLKDGTGYIFTPNLKDMANSMEAKNLDVFEVQAFKQWDPTMEPEVGQHIKDAFEECTYEYCDMRNDWEIPYKSAALPAGAYLKKDLENIVYLKKQLSSLDPDKKSVLFWHGHGSVEDIKYISVQEEGFIGSLPVWSEYCGTVFGVPAKITKELRNKLQVDFAAGRIMYFKDAFGLTPKFFETYMAPVKGGLFYAGTCYSSADKGVMGNTILSKGFDSYIGTKGSVWIPYVETMIDSFGKYLCEYTDEDENETIKATEALAKAMEKHGETDGDMFPDWFIEAWNAVTGDNAAGVGFSVYGDNFRLIGEWKEAYAEFLKNEASKKSGGRGYLYFDLAYINNDNIPELVIADSGSYMNSVYIYTYYNDEVTPVNRDDNTDNLYGAYGTLSYKEKSGLIYVGTLQHGHASYGIFSMNDDMTTTQKYFLTNDEGAASNKASASYTVNGAKVSKAQFDAKYQEYGFGRISEEYTICDIATKVTDANIKSKLKIKD